MKTSVSAAAAIVMCVASAASAAYINNGGFEETSNGSFVSWQSSSGASSILSSGIEGKSILLTPASNGTVIQDAIAATNHYILTMDVASSAAQGTNRSFNVFIRHTFSTDQINLRVTDDDNNGVGDITIYDGNGHWPIVLANVFTFSSSQTDLKTNHLVLDVDYSTGKYTVTLTNANNVTTSQSGVSYFQITTADGALGTASTLKEIVFNTGNMLSGSWAVVDNVTVSAANVPEPAGFSLLAIGSLALTLRRR